MECSFLCFPWIEVTVSKLATDSSQATYACDKLGCPLAGKPLTLLRLYDHTHNDHAEEVVIRGFRVIRNDEGLLPCPATRGDGEACDKAYLKVNSLSKHISQLHKNS
jgi:hypothetical protein